MLRHRSQLSTAIYAKVDTRAAGAGPALAGRRAGMSALRQAAEEYLATRRALGFMLSTQGRLLLDFVAVLRGGDAEHGDHGRGGGLGDGTDRRSHDRSGGPDG